MQLSLSPTFKRCLGRLLVCAKLSFNLHQLHSLSPSYIHNSHAEPRTFYYPRGLGREPGSRDGALAGTGRSLPVSCHGMPLIFDPWPVKLSGRRGDKIMNETAATQPRKLTDFMSINAHRSTGHRVPRRSRTAHRYGFYLSLLLLKCGV